MSHCIFGPSCLERRMSCPASALAELPYWEENNGSTYAQEGTMLHELASTCNNLDEALAKVSALSAEQQKALQKVFDVYNPYRGADGNRIFYERNLEFKVENSKHICTLESAFLAAMDHAKSTGDKRLEDKVSSLFSSFQKTRVIFFGTADFILVNDAMRLMILLDLKFGRVPVESGKDNLQTTAYALAAKQAFPNVDVIRTGIVQPRCQGNGDTYDFTDFSAIEEFVINVIAISLAKPTVEKSGEHCKYCRAQKSCKEFGSQILSLAKVEPNSFPLASEMTNEELSEFKAKFKMLESYVKSQIDSELKRRAEANQSGACGGYVLVNGRKTTTCSDSNGAFNAAIKLGLTAEQFRSTCDIAFSDLMKLSIAKIREGNKLKVSEAEKVAREAYAPFFDVSVGDKWLKKI